MAKMCGNGADFALVKQERSRTIVGYELKRLEDSALSEWHEVYFPRKKVDLPSIEQVKEAVNADIDAQTDAKILNGYEFTPDGEEQPITVWLSKENQTNFSEAHRLQIVPVKFKLNETEDKQPIYHTFETFDELNRFYVGGVAYINQCLNEGWARKDYIDWDAYDQALNPQPKKTTKKK
jgi:hypothetical protein